MNQITYHRAQHAAHYADGHPKRGHDLETWIVTDTSNAGWRGCQAVVPTDAEYHSGMLTDGVQTWRYVRTAPLTGTCPRCEASS